MMAAISTTWAKRVFRSHTKEPARSVGTMAWPIAAVSKGRVVIVHADKKFFVPSTLLVFK
jgi:hypothetical protein